MDNQQLPVLTVLVGLPRSGKSTLAKTMGYPIVNLDSIRLALTGQPFCEEAESMVSCIAKIMITSLFLAGHSRVIIDATNVTVEDRNRWIDKRWRREFIHITTSSGICTSRALEDGNLQLVNVIHDKKNRLEVPTDEELIDHERDQYNKG